MEGGRLGEIPCGFNIATVLLQSLEEREKQERVTIGCRGDGGEAIRSHSLSLVSIYMEGGLTRELVYRKGAIRKDE